MTSGHPEPRTQNPELPTRNPKPETREPRPETRNPKPSEFIERKEAPYEDADQPDREALRFTKSWHRYPPLHEAVWYHGVNLGEVDEYILLPEIITALLERDEGMRR